MKVAARAASPRDLDGAEPILERLDLAAEARGNLERLAGVEIAAGAWAVCVELEGTWVIARGDGERWAILAPAGSDESEAALAARKLHGLLGEQSDGWDLDR